MKTINKATLVLGISALAVNVAGANGIATGPMTPNATAPVATGYNAVAVGVNSNATGPNALAIGVETQSKSDNTIALGSSVTTTLNNSIGIGSIVNANGVSSVAIGHTVETSGTAAVNIGNINVGASKYSTLIGSYNVVDHHDHLETPQGDILIGNGNTLQDGYHGILLGKDSTINNADYAISIGNSTSVTQNESVAIGHNSIADTVVGTTGATINNTNHNFSGSIPVGAISIGNIGKERTITNVSAGRISDVSTDAINGSQLYGAIEEINANGQQINGLKSRVDRHDKYLGYLQSAIVNGVQRIDDLDTKVADNTTTINNTTNQVNINTKDIADLKGKIGSTAIRNELNNRINQTEHRMNKLGASSAALAGLHPLDFNRNDKASYSVSYGHYRNANAVALGAFYRPNERVMIGAGMTLGGENQYTLNVAFKTGKGSDYVQEAKDAQSRISKLEALVNQLVEEVELSKQSK